jgi:hypothetical protein
LTAYLGGAVVLAGVAINVFSTAKRQRAL